MKQTLPAFISIATIAILLTACSDEKDDITNDVNKEGSVETSVSVQHLSDSTDVLITKHTIWSKNNLHREVFYHDTIPALGYTSTNAENEDGDTKHVNVKKDYEVYITVK